MERIVHGAERLAIMEALKRTPEAVEEAIAGLPEHVLRYRPAEGQWSIKEVVGHLRDKLEVWGGRLHMTWTQTDPMFTLFDQEAAVREKAYQDADLGPVLVEMRVLTLEAVALLGHAADWSRLGRHPELGRKSLRQWTEYLLAAQREHLSQIAALRQAAEAAAAR